MITSTLITTLTTEIVGNPAYAANVAAQNYAAIAKTLNTKPMIPNPTPQGTVPIIPTVNQLLTAVQPSELSKLYEIPGLADDIKKAITTKSLIDLQDYLVIVNSFNILSSASQSAVQALLAGTQPDPTYQAQIPGESRAEVLGIYPVTADQVQYVLTI